MTATDTEGRSRLLSTAEVCKRLGIGRTRFYELRRELAQKGRPVEPVRLGYRTLRWPEDGVQALTEALVAAAASYKRARP